MGREVRRVALGRTPHRSDEWRRAHGVYTPEQIARWNSGSAGHRPADMDGKDGQDATPQQAEPHLPADPAPTHPVRVMPPGIPLADIAHMVDADTATVTAEVTAVRVLHNKAGAQQAVVFIGEIGRHESLCAVKVSPAAWSACRHHLTPRSRCVLAIAASRDDDHDEIVLWLTSAATLDWTTVEAADLTAADGAP